MAANIPHRAPEGLEAALIIGMLVAYSSAPSAGTGSPPCSPELRSPSGCPRGRGDPRSSHRQLPERTLDILEGQWDRRRRAMTWVVFWMAKTAGSLRVRLESSLDKAVGLGRGAVFALALVAVDGKASSRHLPWTASEPSRHLALRRMVLGLATAVVLGWAIYRARSGSTSERSSGGPASSIVLAPGTPHGLHEFRRQGSSRSSPHPYTTCRVSCHPNPGMARSSGCVNFSPTHRSLRSRPG